MKILIMLKPVRQMNDNFRTYVKHFLPCIRTVQL